MCSPLEPIHTQDPSRLSVADHHEVVTSLKNLGDDDLIGLGTALGLLFPNITKMKPDLLNKMVHAWLIETDNVTRYSGTPSWKSLTKALEDIGQKGVASAIKKSMHNNYTKICILMSSCIFHNDETTNLGF